MTALPDSEIVRRIDDLVEEEHRLERSHASEEGLSEEQAHRLRHLEEQLDQAWDLLRQRRARRHAGLDPSDARPRDPEVVEHYQQ
ncbi:MAG TPA: DUF2630 family protein [Acidimicrobiales bacterium]|nr:DUF2630 family protein [Acidimicrobiales bacterium]